jgi:hypothetical protein
MTVGRGQLADMRCGMCQDFAKCRVRPAKCEIINDKFSVIILWEG